MKRIGNAFTIISSLVGIGISVFLIVLFTKLDAGMSILPYGLMLAIASIVPLIKVFMTSKVKNNKVNVEELEDNIKFDEIYNEIRDKHTAELERIKKQVKLLIAVLVLSIIGNIIMLVWINYIDNDASSIIGKEELLVIMPTVVVVFFFVALFMFSSKKSAYKRKYKELVVNELIQRISDGLKYRRYAEDNSRGLMKFYGLASFDKIKYNNYEAEDCIYGNLTEKLTLDLAELSVAQESGSNKNRTVIHLFEGLFVHLHGIKELSSTIKILNDKNKMLPNNIQGLCEVKMDSSEFERLFNVYSDAPVVAMQILTSDIMEKLVAFENRLDIHYELLIYGTEIFMRFFTKNLFEPAIFNEATEKNRIRIYYEILNLIIDISKELDKVIEETEV